MYFDHCLVLKLNKLNRTALSVNRPISHKIHVSILVVPQLETWSMSHFRGPPTNTQTKVSEDSSSAD